ncbi:hypothetical protein [Streptomyces sp. NPDC048002]|uniref:hypothetical protein n=1 Tax=Streptomyces sp. NPDC048002 TaxID=3154344 RepID=UPI0033F24037
MTKHRGRHRRRKRGRALRGVLAGTALALTAAATMISASQATVEDDPGALKPLTSAAALDTLRLSEDLPAPDQDDRAAEGRSVGVGTVLDAADRTLRDPAHCTAGERAALPVAPAATHAYCWDADDTRGWRSRAVTTSGDADDDGRWGEHRVVLSAWSAPGASRVAFVDAGDLDRLRYSWVLLAAPARGGTGAAAHRALRPAVSGMVWYQDKLLVGAGDGVYVYDMHRIRRADAATAAEHGTPFVLPAAGVYRAAGHGPVSLSLDRTTSPDSLVASGDGLLRRYAFSKEPGRAGLLATGRPSQVYRSEVDGAGGVLSYRSRWYVTQGAEERGTLWRQSGGEALATRCGAEESHACWSAATPSLSYWEERGEVWSQSGRALFALPLDSIDNALG